jgi:hypothetical protein
MITPKTCSISGGAPARSSLGKSAPATVTAVCPKRSPSLLLISSPQHPTRQSAPRAHRPVLDQSGPVIYRVRHSLSSARTYALRWSLGPSRTGHLVPVRAVRSPGPLNTVPGCGRDAAVHEVRRCILVEYLQRSQDYTITTDRGNGPADRPPCRRAAPTRLVDHRALAR